MQFREAIGKYTKTIDDICLIFSEVREIHNRYYQTVKMIRNKYNTKIEEHPKYYLNLSFTFIRISLSKVYYLICKLFTMTNKIKNQIYRGIFDIVIKANVPDKECDR